MFQLNPEANINGTSLQGYVRVAAADLVARFGQPEKSDGYKVSGEYLFTDETGRVFTIYEYKETSLYDGDGPSPQAFWSSTVPFNFHIGAMSKDGVDTFAAWIQEQVQGAKV